jgi:hypothetical protein
MHGTRNATSEIRLFTAYILVTVVAASVNGYAAYADFTQADWIVQNMIRYGVPRSWLPLLAVLKAAAAVGLLVGIGVHIIGSAAAIGLIAYFVGAIVTVIHARVWSHLAYPVLFLLPPTVSLVLLVAST